MTEFEFKEGDRVRISDYPTPAGGAGSSTDAQLSDLRGRNGTVDCQTDYGVLVTTDTGVWGAFTPSSLERIEKSRKKLSELGIGAIVRAEGKLWVKNVYGYQVIQEKDHNVVIYNGGAMAPSLNTSSVRLVDDFEILFEGVS